MLVPFACNIGGPDLPAYGLLQVILDLQEECGKYGAVTRVIVPRPPVPSSAPELFGSNNYGKART